MNNAFSRAAINQFITKKNTNRQTLEIKYFFYAINNCLRLQIRVVCGRNFYLKCVLIEFVIPNLIQIYFCKTKNL